MDYRYGSHTGYNIEYHFVWVTQYRYTVLIGRRRTTRTGTGPANLRHLRAQDAERRRVGAHGRGRLGRRDVLLTQGTV